MDPILLVLCSVVAIVFAGLVLAYKILNEDYILEKRINEETLKKYRNQVQELEERIIMEQNINKTILFNFSSINFDQSKTKIPSEYINFMLKVCHPDKNNNSPESTEITKWLLNERKR